ncbi:MAG TPA: AMP-binding protein, partial [Thermoanaerobaculia bacterium]|nr:AMP-binding protein [Thermoanaerobaculia bacterium]
MPAKALETVVSALERAAEIDRGGLRFVARDESERLFGWPEIWRRAEAVAGSLQGLSIRHGERVAIVLPTGIEFFDAFFGILLAGAVPVPLYPPVRLGRLSEYHAQTAALLTSSGARLVLTEPRLKSLLGESIEKARPDLGCRAAAELPLARFEPQKISESDLGLVQFSSGTTVEPKPVALSHRALMAQTQLLNSYWPERQDFLATGVSWLPLYHDMGLIGCVLPAIALPSVQTLIGPELFVARPALWLRAISRHRAFISPAPNFAYGLSVAKIRDEELEGVDLSSWKV